LHISNAQKNYYCEIMRPRAQMHHLHHEESGTARSCRQATASQLSNAETTPSHCKC